MMIVRFTNWRYRTQVFRSRKKSSVTIRVDLTKARLAFLKQAQAKVKSSDLVDFVFPDVNCNIVMKMKNNSYHHIKSIEEIDGVLLK